MPIQAILPIDQKYNNEDDYMVQCYQDAMPQLQTVYLVASRLRIGVYLSVHTTKENETATDIDNYLKGIENVVKTFKSHDSFIGIDVLSEPRLSDQLCKEYWQRAYKVVRKYSPDALLILSDRYRWQTIESDNMWPRLAPDITGIMVDVHVHTKRMNLKGLEFSDVVEKVAAEV